MTGRLHIKKLQGRWGEHLEIIESSKHHDLIARPTASCMCWPDAYESLAISFDRGIDDPAMNRRRVSRQLQSKVVRQLAPLYKRLKYGCHLALQLLPRTPQRRCGVQPSVPLRLADECGLHLDHKNDAIPGTDQVDLSRRFYAFPLAAASSAPS